MDNIWIRTQDKKPPIVLGADHSENVLAICEGIMRVMAYCYIDDGDNGGWNWCDCGGDIHGDPEFDDDYKVTHWQPLPSPPK